MNSSQGIISQLNQINNSILLTVPQTKYCTSPCLTPLPHMDRNIGHSRLNVFCDCKLKPWPVLFQFQHIQWTAFSNCRPAKGYSLRKQPYYDITLFNFHTVFSCSTKKKISRWLHKRKKTKQNAVNTHRVLVITMKLILAFRITQTCNYNRCLTMVGDGRLLYPHLYPKNWIWNKLLWRWWEKEFEKAVITTLGWHCVKRRPLKVRVE